MIRANKHKPVMVNEVLSALEIEKLALLNKQPIILDATLGAGGHAVEIIKKGCFVFGIDADEKMVEVANENLEKACLALNKTIQGCFKIVRGNFTDIKSIAEKNGTENVDGALFDLGISSLHFEMGKGYSFLHKDDPLDMRLSEKDQNVTAADLINALPEGRLSELFKTTMSKSASTKLSRKIVEARKSRKLETTGDLLKMFPDKKNTKLHPATLPFLALRIAVNTELDSLIDGLESAYQLLEKGRNLAVISFHSREDKIVKKFMKEKLSLGSKIYEMKKPSSKEVVYNKRARSAKLRVLKK